MEKHLPIPVALVFFLLLLAAVPVRAETIGQVVSVEGDVRLNPQAANRPLRVGDAIAGADVVVTGADGRVTIQLEDGSELQIEARSELRLSEYRLEPRPAGLLDLTRGRLRAIVTDTFSRHKESFRVRSLTAVMGVQGTDFLVFAATDVTFVRVNEGLVRVANLDPSIPGALVLGPGEAARIPLGAAPQPLQPGGAGPAAFGSGGSLDLRSGGSQADAPDVLAPQPPPPVRVPPLPNPPRP